MVDSELQRALNSERVSVEKKERSIGKYVTRTIFIGGLLFGAVYFFTNASSCIQFAGKQGENYFSRPNSEDGFVRNYTPASWETRD